MKRIFTVLCLIVTLGALTFAAGEKARPDKSTALSGEIKAAQTTQEKKATKVTYIQLGSDKCTPCRMMAPIIEEIKQEYPQVELLYYDVWTREGQPYGQKYNIRAIPTQVFLDAAGNEYFRHVGFFPKEELVKVLEQGFKK
jgi:thioredoxin 1